MQDFIYAAFERVPPAFRRTGRSHKYNWNKHPTTSDPFDEISPITISQGEFRDDHGLLARRVEQINCRSDAARPLHNQSARFDVLRDGGFRAPVGHENYCSCSSVGPHQFSNAAGFHLMPGGLRLAVSCRKPAVTRRSFGSIR